MDYLDLLARVKHHLARLPLDEGYIKDRAEHVFGMYEGDRIVVNAETLIVQTLLHEGIHAAHERWGEKRVERETTRLLATLTDRQVRGIYRTYLRRKQTLDETVDISEEA